MPPAPQARDAPNGEPGVHSHRRLRQNADEPRGATRVFKNRGCNVVIQQHRRDHPQDGAGTDRRQLWAPSQQTAEAASRGRQSSHKSRRCSGRSHLPVLTLYRGIAESLTVGFVSFGLLAAAWMLVAVGTLRRHATS